MSCLLIALCLLGLNAYRKLSLERMPSVDIPYATIVTTWVGASAEDIEKDITRKIEDAVSGLDGLKQIESSSMENVSVVRLQFNFSVNIDTAANDVREKVDTILERLPNDAERPVIQKIDINATPVVTLFLTGSVPLDDLYDFAVNRLSDQFATVSGVAEVQVIGGNEREVWIELDRDTLAASGLTSLDVSRALQAGIINLPSGNIRSYGEEFSVRFDAEYQSIPDIAEIIVVSRDGARLKLRDLGMVRQATKEVRERATLNGEQGIIIKIVKKAEGNTVAVVRESQRRYAQVVPVLPGGMDLKWVTDEAKSIQEVVRSTMGSVFGAIGLCAAILFLFLFNVPATVIVVITMPITMIISLFFMQISGQTLNMVTLMAIGL